MAHVRVLVVDDSATMRAVIKTVLRRDPKIEVIGEAADPYEARDQIKLLNPDVVTLDIEMPRMSGLQFLEKIMSLRPMPVIMLSSLTQKGADDTIQALSIGAFECLAKPTSGDFLQALSSLPGIVKAAANYKPKKKAGISTHEPVSEEFALNDSIVAIGSSTGGVEALLQLLSSFPKNCPPTIITQHMPASFLKTFSQRLDRSIAPSVALAQDGMALTSGQILLSPGGEHHLELRGRRRFVCQLLTGEPVSGHRPSVDVMMASVAKTVGSRAIGVMLTGMGRDGAKGLLEVRRAGGRTLGQDEASCVVYGMPKSAFEIGAVEKQVPLSLMGPKILSLCKAEDRPLVQK